MYPEVQSNDQSCTILNRTIQGTVKAADIDGKCRGMYRVSRGYDNRPVLYAVYGNSLYLIRHDNTYDKIATIPSYGTECHMTETGGYGSAHPHLIIVDGSNRPPAILSAARSNPLCRRRSAGRAARQTPR